MAYFVGKAQRTSASKSGNSQKWNKHECNPVSAPNACSRVLPAPQRPNRCHGTMRSRRVCCPVTGGLCPITGGLCPVTGGLLSRHRGVLSRHRGFAVPTQGVCVLTPGVCCPDTGGLWPSTVLLPERGPCAAAEQH